jgi:hypothetical protein
MRATVFNASPARAKAAPLNPGRHCRSQISRRATKAGRPVNSRLNFGMGSVGLHPMPTAKEVGA